MSNEILAQLLGAHAFDGSPLHVDMAAFHVPFDDPGRGGTESGVLRAAQSTERLGVNGPIGCGKTSVLRYTLDDPTGRSRRSGSRSPLTTTRSCSTCGGSPRT
jgi:hypothetical protein